MKKLFAIVLLLSVIFIGILFFPRTVENGIVVNKTSDTVTIIINGNPKVYKSSVDFPILTVVNFNYNLFKPYAFKVVTPITDRIMLKSDNYYDLETLGKVVLSSKTYYYTVDKENNVNGADSKSVIVGKNNIKYFKNNKGELKTFLVFPIDYSSMRVGLSTTSFTSVFHNKIQVKTEAEAKIYSKRENLSMDIPKDTNIIIEKDTNNINLTLNNKTIVLKSRLYISGEALTVLSIKRGSTPFNPSYNGTLEFNNLNNGMTVINEVNLEDYLKKVVPSEMPLTGGIEALKCQAIAARTYAISDMIANRFANQGFYVDDSTRSQVYNNIPMQTLSTKAVESTEGMIMTYNGTPIDAKYYSTSAGTGEDYKDIWFNPDGTSEDKPYITSNNYMDSKKELPKTEQGWLNFYKDTSISALDSDYPYFRWNVEYSEAGITNMLNKTFKNLLEGNLSRKYITIYENSKEIKELPKLKELQDIKILKRGNGGIAIEVSFIFSNATIIVKGDSYIRSAIKCNQDYTNEPTILTRLKGAPLSSSGSLPSSFFSVEKTDGAFTIYGGGFGHGAGMSQYGAIELSKKGSKYEDILDTYYKNIKIDKIY